jgi:hypothetical protein
MTPAFPIFVVICTIFYFYVLLWRTVVFVAMLSVSPVWQSALGAICRFGAAVGISGMMFLGVKEVVYLVTSHRLGIAYDNYIGLSMFGITILVMRALERAAKIVATDQKA